MDVLQQWTRQEQDQIVRVQGSQRPPHYYDNPRQEMAAWVPTTATRILDVGCGRGQLGHLLRQRGHWVSGIELIPEIADQASRHLDEVVCGDVETLAWPWPATSFDAIVCGDVLEHLLDPWHTLARLTELLKPGGVVVASIPNVQNYRVIRNLLRGRWTYQQRGLLDVGHLRFFTGRSMRELFARAGLVVVRQQAIYHRTAWRSLLGWLSGGRWEAFLARYYLMLGQKPALRRKEGTED